MSTLKADAITSASSNTDVVITGAGTGKVDIETGLKVSGTAGLPVADLRVGTDGELITWDASGDPAVVAVGTSTHVLTSNGAGAAPTFQAAGGGGAWNLIGTAVASNSASLTITGLSSTYDTYVMAVSDFVPATDVRKVHMRFGDSSGIDSGGADYEFHLQYWHTNNTGYAATASTSESVMKISFTVGNDSSEGYGGMIYLHRPGDGTTFPRFTGHYCYRTSDSSAETQGGMMIGARKAVIVLDRAQIFFETGNITSGRFTVWGIAHA